MLTFVGALVAAYFLMGVSFTPSNIGIFGDELSMKGESGEVGLDADNAETQEIVDEEVIGLEEAGHWGTKGRKSKTAKRVKVMDRNKDLVGHNHVGSNEWVENKDWWQKFAPDMDTSKMTKKEMKNYEKATKKAKRARKKIKVACKKNPELENCQENADTDLDSIRDKLANHYKFESTGAGKENFPPINGAPDREGGGKKKNKDKHKNKHKNENNADRDGSGEEEKVEVVTEESLQTEENEPVDGKEDDIEEDIVTTTPVTEEPGESETSLNEESETNEPDDEEEDDIEEEITTTTTPATTTTAATTTTTSTTTTTTVTTTTPAPVEALIQNTIVDNFTVLKQVGHDQTSFTQGISYGDDGMIYETTGLYGQSKVRRINPSNFTVKKSVDIDSKYFGEGSTFYRDGLGNGRLIEITWREQTGFIYDSESLELVQTFTYTTTPQSGNQGWGITYDASKQEFIVSDGSKFLYFWDRDTLKEKRKVAVTRYGGSEQDQLNELEFMGGLVCCNIWHKDDIICVDPVTGKSVREYDMSSLWPANQRGGNVLNGIALGKDHVLLTGKKWDRMYKVVFPNWPTLFDNN